MIALLVFFFRCVEISTASSLGEMIPPGALVMLSPIMMGALFGTQALAGMLTGSLVSGVQLAISMSNTGGAWDNAKKYIEVCTPWDSFTLHCISEFCLSYWPQAGNTQHARELGGKGSDCHKAAVIGKAQQVVHESRRLWSEGCVIISYGSCF